MAQWHMRSKRKRTGALLQRHSKKKKRQRGRDFLPAHVGAKRVVARRSGKRTLLAANEANLIAAGKAQKVKILSVVENPADSQFIRRNIITKGAVVETELGRAKVTSRPGQDGVVNAVLIKKK